MSVHRLSASQVVPITLDEAWDFFSSPNNLQHMTPPAMAMTVTSDPPAEMYAGLLVTYTLSPLPLPFYRAEWVTEITHIEHKRFFVDEQRVGPYKFWHHQHHFKEVPGGVEVRDLVHYTLPFGPLGDLAAKLLVKPQLRRIFQFRREALTERFGPPPR